MRSQPLDALACPLSGVNLIEASAGTGKTWTIAALFTRLLLEGVEKADKPPDISEILVVTYTKAATAELQDRLRRRLVELKAALMDLLVVKDPFLHGLLARLANGTQRRQALERVQQALIAFDTAAIYTIHGFCQRMLTDSAFESGQRFRLELIQEDNTWLQQQTDDFWRLHIVEDALLCQAIVNEKETPETWLQAIKPYLGKPYLHLKTEEEADLATLSARVEQAWQTIRCDESGQIAVLALLAHPALKKNKYGTSYVLLITDCFKKLFKSKKSPWWIDEKGYKDLDKLKPEALAGGFKKGKSLPIPPFCQAFADWLVACSAYRQARKTAISNRKLQLLIWLNQRMQDRISEQRSFDDLLLDLNHALTHLEQGPRLAQQIAKRYQVALIDEFQDTDPIQYAIFKRCFIEEQRTVFLVGDPKQAIYRFRGADIFVYLKAREEASCRYTLAINRRSTPDLVNAVNHVFSRKHPFLLEAIDYQPVQAVPHDDLQITDDRPAFCMQWLNTEMVAALTKDEAKKRSVNHCVAEISRLLQLAANHQATLKQHGKIRPLQGGDIAVLVSTHQQGEQIREKLLQNHLPSVSLSQSSVFTSPEAKAMWYLLEAWENPMHEASVRRALSTELFSFDAKSLQALLNNDSAWEQQLNRFVEDNKRLRGKGFMAAWWHCFAREEVAERWLPLPDGERRLTNLMHLAELIQQRSQDSAQQGTFLSSWLAEKVKQPDKAEEALLRLESDAERIKIVTIHSAKGLQYPIVFCPFLWDGKLDGKNSIFWRFHEADQSWLVPDALVAESEKQQARSEWLSEKLRLLYVALTRAQYRQYLAWGWVSKMNTAGLAWLIHGKTAENLAQLESETLDAHRTLQDVHALLAEAENTMGLLMPDSSELTIENASYTTQLAPVISYQPQKLKRTLNQPWATTSFTALTQQQSHWEEEGDYDAVASTEPLADAPAYSILLPGAQTGVMLHDIAEQIQFQADDEALASVIKTVLNKHGFDQQWHGAVSAIIHNTLGAPLAEGATLRQSTMKMAEMAFMFPVKRLDVQRMMTILTDPKNGLSPALREAAKKLNFQTISGYMKGFIDLVCELKGKIYLIDYKSNFLGVRLEDYHTSALERSIAQEHYYLQYLIYCVALRRYMRQRGVDFADRFGGVRYLYLRGLTVNCLNGIWSDLPSQRLLDALEACCT